VLSISLVRDYSGATLVKVVIFKERNRHFLLPLVCDRDPLTRCATLKIVEYKNNRVLKKFITHGVKQMISPRELVQDMISSRSLSVISSATRTRFLSILFFLKKNSEVRFLHVVTHQIHHQGMISVSLDRPKIDNDFSGAVAARLKTTAPARPLAFSIAMFW